MNALLICTVLCYIPIIVESRQIRSELNAIANKSDNQPNTILQKPHSFNVINADVDNKPVTGLYKPQPLPNRTKSLRYKPKRDSDENEAKVTDNDDEGVILTKGPGENSVGSLNDEITKLKGLMKILRDQQVMLDAMNADDAEVSTKKPVQGDGKYETHEMELKQLRNDIKSLKELLVKTGNVSKFVEINRKELEFDRKLTEQKQEIDHLKSLLVKLVNKQKISTTTVEPPKPTVRTNNKVMNQLQALEKQLEKILADNNINNDAELNGNENAIVGSPIQRLLAARSNQQSVIQDLSKPSHHFTRNRMRAASNDNNDGEELVNLLTDRLKLNEDFRHNQKDPAYHSFNGATKLDKHPIPTQQKESSKPRASNNNVDLDSLMELLDQTESKTASIELDDNAALLNELQKLSKKAKKDDINVKLKKLQKQIKHLQDLDSAKSKSLDDDDTSDQIKTLKLQLKLLQSKESKSLGDDDADLEINLKRLENAIDSLRPNDDDFDIDMDLEEKVVTNNDKRFQLLINKLFTKNKHVQVSSQPSSNQQQIALLIKRLTAANRPMEAGEAYTGHGGGGGGYGGGHGNYDGDDNGYGGGHGSGGDGYHSGSGGDGYHSYGHGAGGGGYDDDGYNNYEGGYGGEGEGGGGSYSNGHGGGYEGHTGGAGYHGGLSGGGYGGGGGGDTYGHGKGSYGVAGSGGAYDKGGAASGSFNGHGGTGYSGGYGGSGGGGYAGGGGSVVASYGNGRGYGTEYGPRYGPAGTSIYGNAGNGIGYGGMGYGMYGPYGAFNNLYGGYGGAGGNYGPGVQLHGSGPAYSKAPTSSTYSSKVNKAPMPSYNPYSGSFDDGSLYGSNPGAGMYPSKNGAYTNDAGSYASSATGGSGNYASSASGTGAEAYASTGGETAGGSNYDTAASYGADKGSTNSNQNIYSGGPDGQSSYIGGGSGSDPNYSINGVLSTDYNNGGESSGNTNSRPFPGYQGAAGAGSGNAAGYEGPAAATAANNQQPYQNPASSKQGYARQKVTDLQTEIYDLQNIINGFNRPEYNQKPEDKETVYKLNQQIGDLKNVMIKINSEDAVNTDYLPPPGQEQQPPQISSPSQSYPAAANARKIMRRVARQVNNDIQGEESREADDMLEGITSFIDNILQKDEGRSNEEASQSLRISEEEKTMPRSNNPELEHVKEKLMDLRKQLGMRLQHQKPSNPLEKAARQPSYGYHQPSYGDQSYHQGYQSYPKYEYEGTDKKEFFKDKDKGKGDKKSEKKIEIFDKIFTKILDKLIDKAGIAIPKLIQAFFGFGKEKGLSEYYHGDSYKGGGYDESGGYGDLEKTFKGFGLSGYLPMIIIKLMTNLGTFVNYLKKYKFLKSFMVPALVVLVVGGLLIFLIWFLQPGEESYSSIGYDNYGGSKSYDYNGGYNQQGTYYEGGGGAYRNNEISRANANTALYFNNLRDSNGIVETISLPYKNAIQNNNLEHNLNTNNNNGYYGNYIYPNNYHKNKR